MIPCPVGNGHCPMSTHPHNTHISPFLPSFLLPSFAIGFLAAFSSLGLVSRERKDQMKSILGRLRNNFISPLHGQGGDFQVTLPQPVAIQNPGLTWRTSLPPWDLEEWSSQVQYGVRQDFS